MQKNYNTKSKAAIMKYLQSNKEHVFCAADVYSYMQKNAIQVNLATIYRNLDKLTDTGILLKYKTPEDESCMYQYVEPNANCREHIHMQCRVCGKIFHLECDFMKEVTEHLLGHHGFVLECEGSVLTGQCKDCRNSR
ncbi:MAG: transcriptional repressor [Clostridiales bacterium]|nr:transcriptional repressor [Clostridiales bacterium]